MSGFFRRFKNWRQNLARTNKVIMAPLVWMNHWVESLGLLFTFVFTLQKTKSPEMPIKKIFKPFRNEILKFIFYAKVQHNRTKPYCICFKLSSKNHSEAKRFFKIYKIKRSDRLFGTLWKRKDNSRFHNKRNLKTTKF